MSNIEKYETVVAGNIMSRVGSMCEMPNNK